MDSVAVSIIAARVESSRRKRNLKIQRKILRDACDPFDLDESTFERNFRLNKPAFRYVLYELEHEFDPGVFSCSITPICRLVAVLRFLAGGGYQLGVGNDFEVGMAQSTFSSTLKNVLNVLERRLCPVWIQIEMSESEKGLAKRDFYLKASFPGVIMCVDGTHINIIAPSEEKGLYYNRKGNFSINAMVICDNNLKIRSVDARYPGANHDSHIWNLSDARRYFQAKYQEGERNTWILGFYLSSEKMCSLLHGQFMLHKGDAGYPLEPWLMTPYRCAEAGSVKSIYNSRHSKTRNVVERTIGVMKNRFRCTLGARQLHYSPQKAAQIINVVCALHNICIHYRVPDYTNIPHYEFEHQEGSQENIDIDHSNNQRNAAKAMRDNILNTFV